MKPITQEDIFLSPIRSKFGNEIVFKLNSDDYDKSDIKKITKFLRDRKFIFKIQRYQSKTKLMSFVTFRIQMKTIYSMEENDSISKQIIYQALKS